MIYQPVVSVVAPCRGWVVVHTQGTCWANHQHQLILMGCTNENNSTGGMKPVTLPTGDDFLLNNDAMGLMPDSLWNGVSYASLLSIVTLMCLPS